MDGGRDVKEGVRQRKNKLKRIPKEEEGPLAKYDVEGKGGRIFKNKFNLQKAQAR